MAIERKKLSDYPEGKSFVGLWTLGYSIADGVKQTVRVGLEFIKTAIDAVIEATKNADRATADANAARNSAITQTERAKEQADNPSTIGTNGNWWKWEEAAQAYIDTGVLAKGGMLYPTFEIDTSDMCIYMHYQDEIAAANFELEEDGNLIFKTR